MFGIMRQLADWLVGLIDSEMPAETTPPRTLYAFISWALAGSWTVIGIAVLANMVGGGLEVLAFFLLGLIVDLALTTEPGTVWLDHWPLFLFFAVVALVLRPVGFGLASGFTSLALAPNLSNLIMLRLHRYTLGHAVPFFDNDFAGRISQKEMQTTRALVDVVQETVNAMSFAIASVIGSLILIGSVSGWLVLVLLIWLVIYTMFLRYFLPRLRGLSQTRANARAAVTGQIVDTITNIKTVKLFAGDAHEDQAAVGSLRAYRGAGIKWARFAVLFRIGLITIAGMLPVGLLAVGILYWQSGDVTAGMLSAIGALAIRLSQMTGWISWTLMGVFSNLGEIEDGMRTLSPKHGLVDSDGAVELKIKKPTLNFEDVKFQYGGSMGGVEGITLSVKAGEKLGLVGASGAGKSTLLSLALRLYDPEVGTVKLSGQDLRDVKQDSLRRQISMVTQETAMFNRSARENILYGRPDADDSAMIEAARKAEAHEFIQDLEDYKGRNGYDAHLGERGVKLSGGQRQRIALARAILKDAPVLLLDEATSALDSEVEAQIQKALGRVMEGKTVIAIAHRLSTIARMDRIVVMDQGRVVEEGTHADLLVKGGVYAGLWEHQTGGFLKV